MASRRGGEVKANKTIRWKIISKGRMSWLGKLGIKELGHKPLRYTKNRITTATENTMGCFCFKRREDALFSHISYLYPKDKIIKVQTFGRGKTPNGLWPLGTICYPAVMPLE